MASESEEGAISEATRDKFTAADANGALNPGQNKDVKVDSVPTKISSSPDKKQDGKIAEKNKRKGKKDSMQVLKTTIIMSAVVVVVAEAAFALSEKLREK